MRWVTKDWLVALSAAFLVAGCVGGSGAGGGFVGGQGVGPGVDGGSSDGGASSGGNASSSGASSGGTSSGGNSSGGTSSGGTSSGGTSSGGTSSGGTSSGGNSSGGTSSGGTSSGGNSSGGTSSSGASSGGNSSGGTSSSGASSSGSSGSSSGGSTCNSGPCCLDGSFKGPGMACGEVLKYDYKCDGNKIWRRQVRGVCTGTSATVCKTEGADLHKSSWQLYNTCSSSEQCTEGDEGQPWCKKVQTGCQSGVCCNVESGTPKPKGTKCGTSYTKSERKCIGNNVYRRKGYKGCDGTTTTYCSSSSSNYYWTEWTKYQTCSSSQICTTAEGSAYCKTNSTGKPDLSAYSLTAYSSTVVKPGGYITVRYTRKNIGSGKAYGFYDAWYLSTNTTISSSDKLLTTQSVSSMSAGSTYGPYTKKLYISTSTKPGTYYIGYKVDYKSQVSEVSESNNVRTLKITVSSSGSTSGSIDLAAYSFYKSSSSTTLYRGKYYTFTYRRKNYGTKTAPSCYDAFYLSTNSTISGSDKLLKSVYSSSLSGGSTSTTKTVSLYIPTSAKTGTNYIGYYVDYKNTVPESSSTNNIRKLSVYIK